MASTRLLRYVEQRDVDPGGDVVDLAADAEFDEQSVSAHDVAHVAEVATRREVADDDLVRTVSDGGTGAG